MPLLGWDRRACRACATTDRENELEYRQGENVVIPGCGVGRISAIETMEVEGERVQFYRIDLGEKFGLMWVPTLHVEDRGVRPVMSAEQAERTWEVIIQQEMPDVRAPWNRRQRRYTEMIMSNSPQSLAEVLGELSAVRRTKVLSFTEKKMFLQVWELLVAELAAAMGVARSVIVARMQAQDMVPSMAAA